MSSLGKRRGPKPEGPEGDAIISFDAAIDAIAKNVKLATALLSEDAPNSADEAEDILRNTTRQLDTIAYVAKGFQVRGPKAGSQLKRAFRNPSPSPAKR